MANTQLQDNQQVVVTLSLTDDAGLPSTATLDAGSVTATFADATEFTTTVNDDGTITVASNGILVAGDVLTINGTSGGAPMKPAFVTFDEIAGPASTIVASVGAPTAKA